MEKISGIVRKSPRVAAVDLRDSGPVRSGVPAFGRDQATSTERIPLASSTAERSVEAMKNQAAWRSREMQRVKMAREVGDRFAARPEPVLDPGTMGADLAQTENPVELRGLVTESPTSKPSGFRTDGLKDREGFREERDRKYAIDASTEAQPDGLYPPGSFLDKEV